MTQPTIMAKARSAIVLDHPFFSNILLRHPLIENKQIETIGVSPKGQISYNPDWFEKLPLKQGISVLAHEILHYASMHAMRQGNRDPEMWNSACDAWNNGTLAASNIGELPPNAFRMPDAENKTPEQLYEILEQQQSKKPKDGKGQGQGQGQGGNGKGNGDPMQGDCETAEGMTESEKAEQESETKLEVAEAAQGAKMRGNLPGLLAKFVAETIESKIPWYEILERFMTEKVNVDISWSRPNRRYAPDYYLPITQGVGSMGEIVIQVDISGSVSRKEIEYYNGHLKRIIALCNPAKTHVIYTDTSVQHHDEFETADGEEVEIVFHSGGGTDMRAVFDYIDKKGIAPVCVVTLTDGYTPFPAKTDFPAIWCISSDVVSPTGETIPFKMD